MTLYWCSWKCNIFGTSNFDGSDWNSYLWGFYDGIWIRKFGIWLCFDFWFSKMLGSLQRWN